MFSPKIKFLGFLFFIGFLIEIGIFTPLLTVNSVFAHEVEVSGDVAATFHLEPNHNPRAGEKSRVWFALTRKGGQIIPLEQCNCQLAVYTSPHKESDKPLMQPRLEAISAEHYKGIPGANIVFPKAGLYDLEISGNAKAGANFKPFKLNYTVTVR
jgi:hypothetical protein